MKSLFLILFPCACFGLTVSPEVGYVLDPNNYLSTSSYGDLNGDGITNLKDFAIAARGDITKVVIWGKTPEDCGESLVIASAEAEYEHKRVLSALYIRSINDLDLLAAEINLLDSLEITLQGWLYE